jgi:diaminopimelate epimerase
MPQYSHQWYRMHGCGNHFSVIIDSEGTFPSLTTTQAAILSNPNTALGGDGILVIRPRAQGAADEITVEMFNPDGSCMGMCGNGIRCVAEAWDTFLGDNQKSSYTFNVQGRKIRCQRKGPLWSVAMGKFSTAPIALPIDSTEEHINALLKLSASDSTLCTCVSMGNPHCVIFVDEVTTAPVTTRGPIIETHPYFPQRTNVEFVKVIDDKTLAMRVWERGAGETQSCGTGACASAVAALLTKKVSNNEITVQLSGGTLVIAVEPITQEVTLTGPATWIAIGQIHPSLLDGTFSRE